MNLERTEERVLITLSLDDFFRLEDGQVIGAQSGDRVQAVALGSQFQPPYNCERDKDADLLQIHTDTWPGMRSSLERYARDGGPGVFSRHFGRDYVLRLDPSL